MPPFKKQKTLKWSQEMQDLYNEEVVERVKEHDFTVEDKRLWLGYSINEIASTIVQKGRADFNAGYSHPDHPLTPKDKTLLYCFCNMRLHFFEALATFRKYGTSIRPMFADDKRTMMIDLGCGPGTAGLAMGEFVKRAKFDYVGLDIARPMRDKARSLIKAAAEKGVLANGTTCAISRSWAELLEGVTFY